MALGTSPKSSAPWMLSRADGLAAQSQDVLLLLGRVLLGWIFVQSGWRKLMDIPAFVATMPRRGLPDVLGYIAPPVEFIGGVPDPARARHPLLRIADPAVHHRRDIQLAPLLGLHRRARNAQQQHTQFWKNVSMMGGQVLLFVAGAGRYSLDRLLMRDRR